jgi:hypothetical protein
MEDTGNATPRAVPPRYLRAAVAEDLARKMVFIGGPRQVGKTSLARSLLGGSAAEFNYDVAPQREALIRRELPEVDTWFFDEIHKYRGWRNYLKGLVDQFGARRRILVTGSARLDLYRYGGDSLQGRYFHFRLHPLSVAELGGGGAAFADLMAYGGFPEPFLRGSDRFSRRWSAAYRDRLVREEVTGLERVSDLDKLHLLAMTLPARVGSPLSLNALREDLQVAHATLTRWVDVLERLYGIFRVAPFGAQRLRAVRKERKHYHYDWSVVPEPAARFENLVASHLLKWVEYQIDAEGRALELRYFRDRAGREVDFVITEAGVPISFIECKLGDAPVSPALRYLHASHPQVAAWQISANGARDYVDAGGVRVAPAARCLADLV